MKHTQMVAVITYLLMEKVVLPNNLVCAKDLKEANTLMEQHLSQGLSDMRLDAIVKTKIIDLI